MSRTIWGDLSVKKIAINPEGCMKCSPGSPIIMQSVFKHKYLHGYAESKGLREGGMLALPRRRARR